MSRGLRVFGTVFLALSLLLLTPIYASYKVNTFSLPNGLTVYHVNKASSPLVSVQVWYNVGSIDEQPGQRGIAHLFEHMMFRGSKHVGPEEHSTRIKKFGGFTNAYTSDDKTVYYETLPVEGLALALELEAERMVNLTLNDTILKTEVQVVKEEYRFRYENNPNGDIYKQAREIMFPIDAYAIGPIGLIPDLDKLTVKNCQKFYTTYYSPNNAFLVIVGDVELSEVKQKVTTFFGPLKPSKLPQKKTSSASGFTPSVPKHLVSKLALPMYLVAYPTPPANHKDQLSLDVLDYILTTGESSLLYKKLVRKRQVASYVYGFNFSLKHRGMLAFPMVHNGDKFEKLKKNFNKEISKIIKYGVPKAELNRAKNQLVSQFIFERLSADKIGSEIGNAVFYYEDPTYYDDYMIKLKSVSQDEIKKIAKKYLSPDKQVAMHFSPGGNP